MLSSFWYEQRIGELPLTEGICLPFTTTLEEAKRYLANSTQHCAIAVANDHNECIGTLSTLAIWQGLEQHGAAAPLSELDVTPSTILCADELILTAIAKFEPEIPALFAVTDNGQFLGFMSCSKLLKHIVENHLKVPCKLSQEVSNLSREFVSQVAHDIRNPLSIISAVSGLLEQGSDDPNHLIHYTKLIQRASQQTLQISDGLIQMDRYTCKGNISAVAVDLADFLKEIEEENAELVRYRGQSLVVTPCAPKTAVFDTYLIRRALLNLIDNACKFSKAKARVYVTAECRRIDDTEIVEFAVKDEGIGIKEHDRHIFEPFQQLATDKDAIGYGLGLTIAKRFVQFHNGTIKMQRIATGGTAFVLAIPYQATP